MTNWKEYITIDTLTLVISIATLVVSIAALIVAKRAYKYNRAKDIQVLKTTIAQKEAQLDSMKTASWFGFVGDNRMAANKMSLEKEIEQLRKQL
ncbi:MAG: hypothetical protein U0L57_02645 [Bacteroidales bacterium]|nr:hypothetical protein [Bacteroidales bacterium]